MTENQKYLNALNTVFEKYVLTKSLSAYKRFNAKVSEGEKLFKLRILGYDLGYMSISEFSVRDFATEYSSYLKDFKRTYWSWLKVYQSRDDEKLEIELRELKYLILDNLMEKCGRKFRNGKYVLEKSDNRVYLQWGDLLSESYAEQQTKKKPAIPKSKRDKFIFYRKLVKELRDKYPK